MPWIKCSEMMPECANQYTERMLVVRVGVRFDSPPVTTIGYHFKREGWYSDRGVMFLLEGFDVTHWMPLPDPPIAESVPVANSTNQPPHAAPTKLEPQQ